MNCDYKLPKQTIDGCCMSDLLFKKIKSVYFDTETNKVYLDKDKINFIGYGKLKNNVLEIKHDE